MLRYLTAGESHGPALTAIVEGFPSGVALDTALDRPRARAPPGRLRARQAAEAGDGPDHRRVGRLSRRDHGRPDHAPPDQQRRQARASGRAGLAAGRPHRPGRLHQLSDRDSPGARTRQRPRDRAAGRRRRPGQALAARARGSRSSAMSASWGASPRRRSRLTWRFATPARSTRSTPRPTRRSSPRSTRRGRPATRWAESSRRS